MGTKRWWRRRTRTSPKISPIASPRARSLFDATRNKLYNEATTNSNSHSAFSWTSSSPLRLRFFLVFIFFVNSRRCDCLVWVLWHEQFISIVSPSAKHCVSLSLSSAARVRVFHQFHTIVSQMIAVFFKNFFFRYKQKQTLNLLNRRFFRWD